MIMIDLTKREVEVMEEKQRMQQIINDLQKDNATEINKQTALVEKYEVNYTALHFYRRSCGWLFIFMTSIKMELLYVYSMCES